MKIKGHSKIHELKESCKRHAPHIFGTGAVLSSAAGAAVLATGASSLSLMLDWSIVLAIIGVIFLAAFIGSILKWYHKHDE